MKILGVLNKAIVLTLGLVLCSAIVRPAQVPPENTPEAQVPVISKEEAFLAAVKRNDAQRVTETLNAFSGDKESLKALLTAKDKERIPKSSVPGLAVESRAGFFRRQDLVPSNRTALYLAAFHENKIIFKLLVTAALSDPLLAEGVLIARDAGDESPFMSICIRKDLDLVKSIIEDILNRLSSPHILIHSLFTQLHRQKRTPLDYIYGKPDGLSDAQRKEYENKCIELTNMIVLAMLMHAPCEQVTALLRSIFLHTVPLKNESGDIVSQESLFQRATHYKMPKCAAYLLNIENLLKREMVSVLAYIELLQTISNGNDK